QDCEVQRHIEREVRIREGACKLLAACSQRDQALEASKTLLTSSSRIMALMSRLQKMKQEQAMQRAARRYPYSAHVDTEIHDTDLLIVDRTLTDICFEEPVIFSDAVPGFALRVELWSCSVEQQAFSSPSASSSSKRLSRLGTGNSSSKRLSAPTAGEPALFLPPPSVRGPKFQLLAHASLNLSHVQNSFRTHDLTISDTEDSSFWLPLYGSMCCRLVAQPLFLTQNVMCGNLRLQSEVNPEEWRDVYGVLSGSFLKCYQQQEQIDTSEAPVISIPINKDTRVRASEKDAAHNMQSISITNQSTLSLLTPSSEDTQLWMEAFWQHFYDMSEWKQCCDEIMTIEEPVQKKSVTLKQGSLFHEMVTPSSSSSSKSSSAVNSPVSSEIQSLLNSYYNHSLNISSG
ncbi:hypothetical protein DNTS_005883, partial [Danionella cerebrum]